MTLQMMQTQSCLSSPSSQANIEIYQPFDKSYGDLVKDVAVLSGMVPTNWQHREYLKWGAVDEDGKFIHKRVGGSIPRQAGKSAAAIPWVIFLAAFLGAKVLWTDHNYSTTCEMIRRFRNILGTKPNDPVTGVKYFNKRLKSVSLKTAQEAFFFKAPYEGGPEGSIHFSTRTKTAALGFSFDVLVLDEAQELLDEHMQALLPTTTSGALHNPQYIYLGTPRRAGSPADRFEKLRKEAQESPGADLCYTEFGLKEVGDIYDETRWLIANPSLSEGVANIDAIRAAIPQMDKLAFAQEYLGVWLSPLELAGNAGKTVLTKEDWDKCAISEVDAVAPGAYSVKFSVDGSYFAVSMAVQVGDKTHVELIDKRETYRGKRALIEFISARGQRIPFVIDGKSGANSLLERLDGIVPGHNLITPSAGDVISAADGFVDAVNEQTLTWFKPKDVDSDEVDLLTESVITSYKRKIGNSGGWGFDGENCAVIESAALAVWYARLSDATEEQEVYF